MNKQKQLITLFSPLMLSILLIYSGLSALLNPQLFKIKKIIPMHSLTYVEQSQLQQLVLQKYSEGYLYSDVNTIKQTIESMPWVVRAEVRKVWPDTLQVNITENQALAQWGSDEILNNQGTLFKPDDIPHNLVKFQGPKNSQTQMIKQYHRFVETLETAQLSIVKLHLSDRFAWQITLDNGILLKLGKKDTHERLKRFTTSFHGILAEQNEQRIRIMDLRYPNGFAVTREALKNRT